MSAQTQAAPAMNLFERYLSVWVALCIAIGILLGQVMPASFALSAVWRLPASICRSVYLSG